MKIVRHSIVLILICSFWGNAQEIISLYPEGKIPNAKKTNLTDSEKGGLVRRVITPTLEIYQPDKENTSKTAVIICPGGGYGVIVFQGEGVSTAKEFAKKGITAFVLKYRLPNDTLTLDKKIAPLQDVQQAFKVVRENATKWGIDTTKVGIMGFSAGGHLASTGATHYKTALVENKKNTNLRPDFQILVYPVISMQDSLTHIGSRNSLLGAKPSKADIDLFSNELQVDANTPPAYITHTTDDKVVDVDNSILYFEKLRHHKVAVEMHIYQKGDHGFIFRHKGWTEPLFQWMEDSKWISKND
jgi:acetyl esterase/lipase